MKQRLVLHWRVEDVFQTSLWYASDDERVTYEGAVCDCDAWAAHRQLPPDERFCVHIERVLHHVSHVDPDAVAGDVAGLELVEIEEVAVQADALEDPLRR